MQPFERTASPGVLTQEAAHGATSPIRFVAATPGTHSYYSGTQGDLQVEMGLYGAIIVLPNDRARRDARPLERQRSRMRQTDFRLAAAAYNHPRPATTASTCSSSRRWIPRSTVPQKHIAN